MGRGCLFNLLLTVGPRLALLCMWLVNPSGPVGSSSIVWPLLGFIFLPFTMLFLSVLGWTPANSLSVLGWLLALLGLLLDMGVYGVVIYSNRHRLPSTGQQS